MEGKLTKKREEFKVKRISVSPADKKQAIIDSIKFSQINKEVDQIVTWINQEQQKLARDKQHKTYLALNFNYSDKMRRTVVDTVLRLFGTRILNDEERADPGRPLSTGIQATNRPNLFIYYEHKRPEDSNLIQEKYTLLVSADMKMPSIITPTKIEEVSIQDTSSQVDASSETPPEILDEKIKDGKQHRRAPGIFETINKVFLGEDEEY